jgi:hypothetical protein
MLTRARTTAAVLAAAALLLILPPLRAADNGASRCTASSGPTRLQGIGEASGLTLSRKTPNLLWSHNDSGAPVLFGIDRSGVRIQVRIPKATVIDWEDISAARCPSGDCLYIADIGDNRRSRRNVTVYRVAEPGANASETSPPEIFTASYPDGPHDAEALFVLDGGLFIITKDEAGVLYRLPQPLTSTPMTFQRVGTLGLRRVTDADASPDGRVVAVRTNDELVFYRATDLTDGKGAPRGTRTSLRGLREPQGEGVALDGVGDVYLASEGTGRAGTLTSLRCTISERPT